MQGLTAIEEGGFSFGGGQTGPGGGSTAGSDAVTASVGALNLSQTATKINHQQRLARVRVSTRGLRRIQRRVIWE